MTFSDIKPISISVDEAKRHRVDWVYSSAYAALELMMYLEAAEMQRRLDDPKWTPEHTPQAKVAIDHKRRTFLLVAAWLRDIRLFGRPGQGGYSAASRDFHEHGKCLSLESLEILRAQGIEIPNDLIPNGELDAV